MSETLLIAPATDAEDEALVSLWKNCGLTRPWNDPRADIAFARCSPNAAVLAGRLGGTVKASAMVGHDGHRGWVYYLAVDPSLRGRGFGRMMMRAAEAWLIEHGVPKLMLMVRADNKAVCDFYEAVGYQRQERVIFARWLDGRPMTP
jgi:ribosomal protein S18 acetylase RimI-like enzyme